MRSSWLVLLSVMCLVGCAAAPRSKNKQEAQARWEHMRAKVKFQLAERNFESGQVDDAMKICQEVLALNPTQLDVHLLMARIQIEKGQTAEAEAALDSAAGLGQPSPELDYLRGVLAENREQTRDALNWYKRAYDAQTNDVEYLLAYVECMLRAEQIDPALELLNRRQHDFEQDVRVQLLLGQALSLRGRNREAGEAYLAVLRLEPSDPLLREEAGLVLLAAGRLNEAQLVLEPLLKKTDTKPSAAVLEAWGKMLLDANDARGAVRVLQETTTRYPQALRPWLLLSQAYLKQNKATSARDAALSACEVQRDSLSARLLLAYCCLAADDRDGAIDAAQQVIAAKPDDAEAMLILERALKTTRSTAVSSSAIRQ